MIDSERFYMQRITVCITSIFSRRLFTRPGDYIHIFHFILSHIASI